MDGCVAAFTLLDIFFRDIFSALIETKALYKVYKIGEKKVMEKEKGVISQISPGPIALYYIKERENKNTLLF